MLQGNRNERSLVDQRTTVAVYIYSQVLVGRVQEVQTLIDLSIIRNTRWRSRTSVATSGGRNRLASSSTVTIFGPRELEAVACTGPVRSAAVIADWT